MAMKSASNSQKRNTEEEEGLHGVHRQLRRNEHPKTKEGCKKFSGKQAVTHRRPTPRKPLCNTKKKRGYMVCTPHVA
jgi:hypothetical protein